MTIETDAAMALLVKQVEAVTDSASQQVAVLLNGMPSILASQGASAVDVATFTATLNAGAPALMAAVLVAGGHAAPPGPVVIDIPVPPVAVDPMPPELIPPLVPPVVTPTPPVDPVVPGTPANSGPAVLVDSDPGSNVTVSQAPPVAPVVPRSKDPFRVKISGNNIGPATFDPGTGPLPIGKPDPTGTSTVPLAANDLMTDDVVDFVLDDNGVSYKYTKVSSAGVPVAPVEPGAPVEGIAPGEPAPGGTPFDGSGTGTRPLLPGEVPAVGAGPVPFPGAVGGPVTPPAATAGSTVVSPPVTPVVDPLAEAERVRTDAPFPLSTTPPANPTTVIPSGQGMEQPKRPPS